MKTFKDINGNVQDYAAAVALMDDELREEIHAELARVQIKNLLRSTQDGTKKNIMRTSRRGLAVRGKS